MAAHAQLVGMTIASECIAACEVGLSYAAICVVDNLANGVGERELTMEQLLAGRAANREAVAGALERLAPALASAWPSQARGSMARSLACGSREAPSWRWAPGWTPRRETR